MKTSTKVILGAYGAFVGVWLAGSAYFWLEGHVTYAEPELPSPPAPLSSEENAYPLFQQLQSLRQTNANYMVVYDYLSGRTNGVAVASEVDAIIASHSNVFACVRQILKCRGVQVPEGEHSAGRCGLFANVSFQLYRIKVMRETERGEIALARKTLDEQFAYAAFLSEHGWPVSYLYGQSVADAALKAGLRASVVADEDAWLKHLAEVAGEREAALAPQLVHAARKELEIFREYANVKTNDMNCLGLVLNGGGPPTLGRFTVDDEGHLTRCMDWERVWRQYAVHFLSLFAGYADYSFNPQLTFISCVERTQEFVAKLQTLKFDRDYAKRDGFRPSISVLTKNWVYEELIGDWPYTMYNRHYQSLFGWRAELLRIACRRYKLRHGRCPASLSELVPTFIAAIPSDPYDDEPIRYNAERAYFWTPGPTGDFDGKVVFGKDGSPQLGGSRRRYVKFVESEKAKSN